MVPDPDAELVRILATGDIDAKRGALAQLYDGHSRRVYNIALRVVGSPDLAEDVVQEVFTRLPRQVRAFRGDASFKSWIYRITVNRAIDRRRRERRRPAMRLDAVPVEPETGGLPGRAERARPEAGLRAGEREEQIQAALLRLSPKLRAIAVLRYVEGLSYEQLAQVLSCSLGTVKSRLNRAHTALQRELRHLAPREEGDAPEEERA